MFYDAIGWDDIKFPTKSIKGDGVLKAPLDNEGHDLTFPLMRSTMDFNILIEAINKPASVTRDSPVIFLVAVEGTSRCNSCIIDMEIEVDFQGLDSAFDL